MAMKSSIVSSLVLLTLLPFKPSSAHPTSWSQVVTENNVGWAKYLADEPSEYHNLPLEWELDTSIPSWIKGSYVKNGPGRRKFGDERQYSSYLDSWGKLHKITFNGEKVSISGRMIETANYNKSVEKGEMVPTITLAHVTPNDW